MNCKQAFSLRRELTKEKRSPSMCWLRHRHFVGIFALNKTPSTLSPSKGFRMGKTLPPFSQLLEAERRRWAPFKRALPKEEQAAFDRLFDCTKLHIQAGVMVSRPWPFKTVVVAVLLEQEKRVGEMVKKLEEFGAGQRVI
jgi:hypothetical protein